MRQLDAPPKLAAFLSVMELTPDWIEINLVAEGARIERAGAAGDAAKRIRRSHLRCARARDDEHRAVARFIRRRPVDRLLERSFSKAFFIKHFLQGDARRPAKMGVRYTMADRKLALVAALRIFAKPRIYDVLASCRSCGRWPTGALSINCGASLPATVMPAWHRTEPPIARRDQPGLIIGPCPRPGTPASVPEAFCPSGRRRIPGTSG